AKDLVIDSARIAQGGHEVEARVLPGGEDFVGFAAPGEPFAAGDAVATIRYHATVEKAAAHGLFRKHYEDVAYLYTQFEAIDARRAFPCFDEPGWKTPWRLTIDAPADDMVVSNTPEASAAEVPGKPGWKRHEFGTTLPLPSYLIAFAIGPFDVVDGGTAGRRQAPLRYIVPKGHGAEARLAKSVTPKVIELLEDYFDIPYPFEKLDSVAVPQFGGAMENAGMITYDPRWLIARPFEETDESRRRYVSIAAHEIGHQWFGDYMTLAWWDDIWLNEAFATWIARKVMFTFDPKWDDGFENSWSRRRALESDRLATARRVRNPVADNGDIMSAFDGITYNKGAEVLSMFESGIGPEKFREGVRLFLKRHALGSGTSSAFFRAVGEASGSTEETLRAFETFVQQPGVPLFDFHLACAHGKATLQVRQQRLRPVGSTAADSRWSTPACFRYPAGGTLQSQCTTVAGDVARVALEGASCPAWVVGNARGVGHYVVRYDATLAKAIAKDLPSMPPHEAVALLGDAGLLAETGIARIDAALDWADAGLAHPSRVVKNAAVQLLEGVEDSWLSASQARRKAGIVVHRAIPLAREIGWKARPGEGQDVVRLREAVMPFAAKYPEGHELRAEADAMAVAWIADRGAIPADIAQGALDTAARFADAAMLEKLEGALAASASSRDRRTLMKAIGKVRDPKLRERALGLSLARAGDKDFLNGRDMIDFIDFALEDDVSRPAVFQYVRANVEPIDRKSPRESLPEGSLMRVVKAMRGLCTAKERAEFVDTFAARAPHYMGGEVAYRQTLESIDTCVAARAGNARPAART
ncbi:MAG TPA: M1 family metallopeptidase, partial [Usitatibacter sp.]|nr:M1 family metallopeptidase [Usitatibacter sp.]